MPVRRAILHRVPMAHPGDTSAIEALFAAGALRPAEIVAILGKTEGNGCVNDFTRAYAVQALSLMLGRHLHEAPEAVAARIAMVMSGGTEGGLSPHFLILAVGEAAAAAPGGALAIGTAFTGEFAPEEIGRPAQVAATAAAVRAAMASAGMYAAASSRLYRPAVTRTADGLTCRYNLLREGPLYLLLVVVHTHK
jgi:cyanuric acid amidohydrolase